MLIYRKLGVQEEELKRAIERAELAESKLKGIEEELQLVSHTLQSSKIDYIILMKGWREYEAAGAVCGKGGGEGGEVER